MSGGRAERIEAAVDAVAAAVFAGAVGFAAYKLLSGIYSGAQLAAFSVILTVPGGLLCFHFLRRVKPEERGFEVKEFALAAIEHEPEVLLLTEQVELLLTDPVELVLSDADQLQPPEADECGELLLTDTDRLRSALTRAREELVLDDILAELRPDSRVVRLFNPAAMPTPGQLSDRIDRHLGEEASPTAAPDASQALYDALAELRRSLG